ncbi:MAG: T9SS type A sorting domain-containing protein, partial [Bacteroidales bacterium]|nr:T9SS type A sorting domain-containing protein [Bacteroidales bacterium]
VNLTLTINQPTITNLTAEICQGETYALNGFNTNTAGLHTLNLETYKGCDSTINLNLIVNPNKTTNLFAVITQGDVYNQNGFNETTTGVYTQTLQTTKGCDSIVNLTLNVYPATTNNINAEICQGETYALNGFNESTEGIYTQTLVGYNGIDSIVTLILTINQPATTNLTAEICQGETYALNGFNANTAGLHTQTLQTYKGCDSTVNLTLTINQPATTNLTAELCQGQTYTLNGFNVNTAGLHTQNLQTTKGCDSTVNLTLTINQPTITNITAEICQGETYALNGFNTSTAGLHTQTLQTYKGCDSTVNLTLTINQPTTTNITAAICQGETYNLNGFNVSTAGLHTQNLQTYKGCDSTVNLTLNINELSTPTNLTLNNIANYIELNWVGNGEEYIIYKDNDSLITTSLNTFKDSNVVDGTNYCYKVKALNSICGSEFSDEVCLTFLSLEEIKINGINAILYPNPASSKVNLTVEGLYEDADVSLYDINGKFLKKVSIKANQNELEIDINELPKGVYSIRIVNVRIAISRKLIVN